MANLTSRIIPHDAHWAIEEQAARQLMQMLKTTGVQAHDDEIEARRGEAGGDEREYAVVDGIAYLSLTGLMTKAPTSLQGGTGTVRMRRMIRAAAADKGVDAIVLQIDSPGGSVSGTQDLADDVAAAAKKKTVCAYVEDNCCSAAYWVASQATHVYANRTALIGSIGTYMVVYDMSRAAENEGIKVHVLSTGKYKGAGVPGTNITDEQLADWQGTVNDLNEHFLSAVAKGRDMARESVEKIADGRVHIAKDALKMGLIDGLGSIDQVVESLHKAMKGAKALRIEGVDALSEQLNDLTDEAPRTGAKLEEALDSALTAVEEVVVRIQTVKSIRESQHRSFSPARLEQVHALHKALGDLAQKCDALNDGKAQSRPDLTKTIRDAELALAIHK